MKNKRALLHPGAEIDADGAHVAYDLLRRFFRRNVQTPFATPACSIDKMSAEAALAGPCGSRNQNAAAAVISPPAQHRVQARDAAGDTPAAHVMV